MPRGRKPKAKVEPVVPVVATPEKKKRGRPKKVVDAPVAAAPPPVVVEAAKVEDTAEPIVAKVWKSKNEPFVPAVIPVDPEQQKLIDKAHVEFKKRLDAAMKDATPENAISKMFEALGGGTVNW